MRLFLCCLLLGIGSLYAQAPNIEPMASTGYGNTVYVWGVRINTQEAGELATQLGATQAAQRLAKVAPSRMVAPALGLGSGLSLGLAFLNIDRQSGELNELGMAAYLSGIGTGLAALFTLGLPERHLRLGVQSFNQHYAAHDATSAFDRCCQFCHR